MKWIHKFNFAKKQYQLYILIEQNFPALQTVENSPVLEN